MRRRRLTDHRTDIDRFHQHRRQANASLATEEPVTTRSSSGSSKKSSNVTIQARLSSSSSTSSPKATTAPAEEPAAGEKAGAKGEAEGTPQLMSRHGTLVEEDGGEEHGEQGPGSSLLPGAAINEEEEDAEDAEDAKYDGVELEETDCPLCHFMRASACGPTWSRWEKCIHYHKEKEEDFVGPCSRVTLRLAQCIERHKDGFPPMLRNALLGGGKEDDEIAEDEAAAVEAGAQPAAGAGAGAAAAAEAEQGVAAAAPETSAALAATITAAAAEAEKEQEQPKEEKQA